ncbi:MAG: hypothetical protein JSV52_06390 [Candidatus Zixiibacteriota bacterium]|nr:MAG: hypothetical protein JSV52_06390 [candidate division Zixibacteria bacterium]
MLAKYVIPLALAAMLVSSLAYASGDSRPAMNLSHGAPLVFTSNEGQWDDQVHFRANINGATIWFATDGVCYEFVRDVSGNNEAPDRPDKTETALECLMIKSTLVGANTAAKVSGEGLLGYKSNYFLGSDPARWRTGVHSYEAIVYHDVYPGIDLRYYYNGRKMEYDFILSPGADPSVIQIRYDGVESVDVNEYGELEITTAWGTVTETCPYIYQQDDSGRRQLTGSYKLISENSFAFNLDDDYNPEMALVIDPVLLYSSFLGGNYTQTAYDNAIDTDGYVVIAGQTRSEDFPTVDPYQGELAGQSDVFATKINPVTSEILYSTYFGATNDEEAPRVALDSEDNICLVFRTNSPDMPTVNPFQSTLEGDRDAFVLKLSSTGDAVLAATYLGGDRVEYPWGITADNQGYMYVCGETDSRYFPLENAYSTENAGGETDGFVTKLSPSGDALIYSTYLGGSGSTGLTVADVDALYDIAVNDAGEAYVAGATYSPDYPAVNALFETMINKEGPTDAIITKFSAAGNTLVFSTFLGGTEDEWIKDIEIDADGNLVIVGSVESDDFPTLNAYQTERCPGPDLGMAAVFMTRMAGDGSALLSSTYLGGCDEDFGEALGIGPTGNIFISGTTYSTDFPMVDPIYGALNGVCDVFLTKFDSSGSNVIYSTYYGGSSGDHGIGLSVDNNDWAHITGYTRSSDLPLVNPTQANGTTYPSGNDVFLAMIKGGCCRWLTGNADGDPSDRLDILDIGYAIDWLFRQGPALPCGAELDTDASGRLDIEDIVYLVNYFFKSGPEPLPCLDN